MVLSTSLGEMKSPLVVEVAAQSGAPAKIQFRIVLIASVEAEVASVWLFQWSSRL